MKKLTGIFEMIEKHTYTTDKCFLCGCLLTTKNKSEEHVIPKWLQSEFNLWDQTITLLNGTYLPYRRLTIPCCRPCNNMHLSHLEAKIKKAFVEGFDAFQKIDRRLLFLWLGKIYFGLMYRELFLKVNRANPDEGNILEPGYFRSFISHFLFLQGIRKRHVFRDFFPASIFLFKCQKPAKKELQWDLIDNHDTMLISIRMGEIGIISPLQDCETLQKVVDLSELSKIDLHPRQFREISAKILYQRFLMNRVPKFIDLPKGKISETVLLSLQGLSNKPIFDEGDIDSYSIILSQIIGMPHEKCQTEKGKVITWLYDDNNKPRFIPID